MHIRLALTSIISAMFVAVGLFAALTAQAQTIPPVDLQGFAWSSTVGWISLNCINDGNCATSDYKVTLNADRTITGYAWSSNIGWIKFGGLSSFPVGGGTAAENARLTGTYPNLTWSGWARACSATLGGTCASMSNNVAAGDWDGWISLRGTNYSIAVNLTSGMSTSSYAWGSDVVGWVDMFTNVTLATSSASLSGVGCTIPLGSNSCSASLTWNISDTIPTPNIFNVASSTQISTDRARTNFPVTLPFGNRTFHARSGTTVLTARVLSATCAPGLVHNGTQCIAGTGSTSPSITLRATPPIVRSGNPARIAWSLSTTTGSTCVLNGPGINNLAVTIASSSALSGALTSGSTFRLGCTGSYGAVEQTVTVDVIPVAAEV
jgi:hypothetical protein